MLKNTISSFKLTTLLMLVGLFLAGPRPASAAPLCESIFSDLGASENPWMNHLADEIQQGDIFDSEGFYKTFQGDPTSTEKVIKKWYSYYSKDLFQAFEPLPTEYRVLLIDPGIATRAEEFASFAKNKLQENPDIQPRQMRQFFSQSLGTTKVFRGLLLTAEEAGQIKEHGMKSRGLMEGYANSRLRSEFDGDIIPYGDLNRVFGGFMGEVDSRLYGRQLSRSMLLSVSKWIEVTSAGAWSPKGALLQPGKTFYLFEMEIPTLSLIRLSGRFNAMTKNLGSWRYYESTQYGSNEKFRVSVDDPDFEMFIFGSVPPAAIKQMHAYEQRPPRWWPAN